MNARLSAPDLCVIGASEAGRAAAMGAVALGLSVTLVDDSDGDGMCNPDLVLELLRIEAMRRQTSTSPPRAWDQVREHLDHALMQASAERRHARLEAMNIRVIRASARFVDAKTVVAGTDEVRARRTIVATGGLRSIPPIAPESEPEQDLTVERLRHLAVAPSHLVIIGGGPDALSVAQSLRRLGSAVTLVADEILPGFDPELSASLLTQMQRDGVVFTQGGAGAVGSSHLLHAEPSRPALDGLELERAGIRRNRGELILDGALRSTNPRVYAVGRVAGATTTAMGVGQVSLILRAAFLRLPVRFRPDTVATVSATDPQIAKVGRSEQEAQALGEVRVWRWPFAQTGAGIAVGSPPGHIKVVTDRGGRILGAGMVGRDVRDLIPFWSLAIDRKLSLADLAEVTLPTHSWSEASRAIILSHAAGRLGSPWIKRLVQAVGRLG